MGGLNLLNVFKETETDIISLPIGLSNVNSNTLLLETLSDSWKSEIMTSDICSFFTGEINIDEQIIQALLSLNLGDDLFKLIENYKDGDGKLGKFLGILKPIIVTKRYSALSKINIVGNCKDKIKTILLTAYHKYDKEFIDKLYSFQNITFDTLEKLNSFDENQLNQTMEIISLLSDEIGTNVFPIAISPDNLENIKKNILSVKNGEVDNIELLSKNEFSTCLLSKTKSTLIDFMTLPNNDFKLVMKSIGNDTNMISISFLGFKTYQDMFLELRKRKLSDTEILKIFTDFRYSDYMKLVPFWIDKGLPIEKIPSDTPKDFKLQYEDCSYIYEHITKDLDQFITLCEFNYDTLLYVHNNITQDVNEIINDYSSIKYTKSNNIKIIYESLKNYQNEKPDEKLDKNFMKIIKFFDEHCGSTNLYEIDDIVAFFCTHFMHEGLGYLDNDIFGWVCGRSGLANYKFLYEKGICNSIDDFLSIKHLLTREIDKTEYLYEKGICTTKDDFTKLNNSVVGNGNLIRTCFESVKFLCELGLYTTLDSIISNNFLFSFEDKDNIKFFYENGICNKIDDFKAIGESFYGYLENKQFLYEIGICTTKDDFIKLGKSQTTCADPNIINYVYNNGICKTLDDFVKLGNSLIVSTKFENFEYVHKKGIFTTLDDFIKNARIITYLDKKSLDILNKLHTNNKDYDERINLLLTIDDISCSDEYKNEIIHKVGLLPVSTARKYIKTCEIFNNSISPDIQVVKESLIMDILNSDNPEKIAKKIETIFVWSHLPIVSKIFQIFKYVYPEDIFCDKLESHDNPSPYLKSCETYPEKLSTIYQDLMKIMIKSSETSLKDFIKSIISNKKSLFDFENGYALDDKGCKQVLSIMKMIISLNTIVNDYGDKNTEILESEGDIGIETLKSYYDKLKKSLLLSENDSIYIFFLNLCKKIGYDSLEEIIKDMDKSKNKAHCNGLSMYNSVLKGQIFNPENNYFLKGIGLESLGEILNRGVTSTEYLGGGEGTNDKVCSNLTPFDTDGVMINGDEVFEVAESHGYGNLDIIINIDKLGTYNTDTGLQGYNPKIYEIFKNHGKDKNYFGIRTGIASTEFDAIIYRSDEIDFNQIQKIKFLIAKNGFYLPIFDLDGNLLFTPDEYHTLRQSFSFSDKHLGCDMEQNDVIHKGDSKFYEFIQRQKKYEYSNSNIDNKTTAEFVFDKIKSILESELGIKCNQDKNLLGAELYDSGSTGRGTEIPSNDIDLDFTLLLNAEDYKKVKEITKVIHEKIGTIEFTDHSTVDGNGWQIKSSTNTLGQEHGFEKGIRFDLLIMKKSQSYLYPSNVAMQDRLQKIEELYGKDTLDFVKENIIIMKKLLKSQGTYKNTEGGIGGIGVENWIMQHHGNFVEALEAFEQITYGGVYEEGKENISFDEFKKLYTIRDCGQNFKDNNNDNYILKMDKDGYKGILNIIKKYRTEGLNGICKLIRNYEQLKAEFI